MVSPLPRRSAALLVLVALSSPYIAFAQTCTASGVSLSTATCGSGSAPNYNNYIKRSLTYSNGIFSGSLTTNTCPKWQTGTIDGVPSGLGAPTPRCSSVTLPQYSAPRAIPVLNNIGYSVHGVNIFSGFDAGFTAGGQPDVCINHLGYCQAGTGVDVCFDSMEVLCGTANLQRKFGLDDCGAHANPYHMHADLICEYNASAPGHSPLTGFALDGRGIYGKYESSGALAVVDACGGHWGDVPAYTDRDTDGTVVSYPAASNVYHYHTSVSGGFTLGCYGPPSAATASNRQDMSLDSCKAMYSGCSSSPQSICTSGGLATVYLWCPCYQYKGVFFNNIITPTPECPACKGNCSAPGAGPSSPRTSPSSSPRPGSPVAAPSPAPGSLPTGQSPRPAGSPHFGFPTYGAPSPAAGGQPLPGPGPNAGPLGASPMPLPNGQPPANGNALPSCAPGTLPTGVSSQCCGDGVCDGPETAATCPADCSGTNSAPIGSSPLAGPGPAPVPAPGGTPPAVVSSPAAVSSPAPGDGQGPAGAPGSCAPGTLPTGASLQCCGDGVCDGPETAATCPGDCAAGPLATSPAGQPANSPTQGILGVSPSGPGPVPNAGPGPAPGPDPVASSPVSGASPAPANGPAPGSCPAGTLPNGSTQRCCGDGVCDGPETSASCPSDCASGASGPSSNIASPAPAPGGGALNPRPNGGPNGGQRFGGRRMA